MKRWTESKVLYFSLWDLIIKEEVTFQAHLRRLDPDFALHHHPRRAGGHRADGQCRQQPAQPERESPCGQLSRRHQDISGDFDTGFRVKVLTVYIAIFKSNVRSF